MKILEAKPIIKALYGEVSWPPPVWLMRQAGRYLPEFRAERDKADFLTRCLTPDIAFELTMQPIRRYKMDAAILFSDILILPWALGQKLEFVDGKGPQLDKIDTEEKVVGLEKKQASGEAFRNMEPVRNALQMLSKELRTTETTLIGFAGSPFTVSCYMVEGQGSRDFAIVRQMMLENKALYTRLMDVLVKGTIEMLQGQIDAGAEAVMLFDSWAGILPPTDFRKWVIEPTKKIRAALRESHPSIPVIGFPRLGGLLIEEYVAETGVNGVGVDTSTDINEIAKKINSSVAVQGNLDPMVLRFAPEKIADEVKRIATPLKGRPFIFNLGHGVMQHTPVENVAKLVEEVRKLK